MSIIIAMDTNAMQCLVVAGSQLLLACLVALLILELQQSRLSGHILLYSTPVKVSTICTCSHCSVSINVRVQSVLFVAKTKLNK